MMDFIEYANNWAKSEVNQARIMIGIGALFLIAFIGILKGQNELLRGAIAPMSLLLVVLLGYGAYILYSRPAHIKESIALYEKSEKEAIAKEQNKHINDNNAGKTLLKVYPILMLVSILALLFVPTPYFKGMALGFALLFIAIFVVDSGFVSRSDSFLTFLSELSPK